MVHKISGININLALDATRQKRRVSAAFVRERDVSKYMTRKIISSIFLVAALSQWYIIGERTVHAFWMWYKFKDYGGDGYTTMNSETIIIGYVLSIAIISIGMIMRKYFSATPIAARINRTAVYMLVAGLLWLTALLLSPVAKVITT